MRDLYIDFIIKYRWIVIALSLALVFVLSSGAKHLSVNSNYRIFFEENNKQLEAFDEIQRNFSQSDNVLFVIAPKEGTVFTKENLNIIKELTEKAWELPLSSRVDSISNYQHTEVEGDELIVADLYEDPLNLSDLDITRIRDISINEPVLINRLVSDSGHVSAVNVTINMPKDAQASIKDLVAEARALKDTIMSEYENVDVHLTGIVMMNNAFSESSKKDMGTLIPLLLLIATLLIGIFLRSIVGSVATLMVIILTVVSSMGFMGWSGWMISGPSSSAPTIIFTMAVADCVHILIGIFLSMRAGLDKQSAIKRSFNLNLTPILITSITTAIGFLSLNFSASPPYHDLGNVVAFGVILAFAFSITFLPALVAILPLKIPAKNEDDKPLFMESLASFVIEKKYKIVTTISVVTLLSIALIPLNVIDDQFLKYFSEKVEFRTASDFTNDNLTGIYNIEYVLDTEKEGGVNNPDYLRDIEKFVSWLRSQNEVVHVYSYTDTLKNINRNMSGGTEEAYELPNSHELASQYSLLYELSLPYGLDVNTLINAEKSAYRVVITLDSVSSKQMLELETRFDTYASSLQSVKKYSGSSPNLIFAHIGLNNANSMLLGMIFAIALITLVLSMAFRSINYGLFSLIPNVIPALMAFGIWGVFSGEVGISVASALGLTIGIVVDDTVHFLSKYLKLRREKNISAEQAIKECFVQVGSAIFVTSVVLIGGFSVFTASTYSMNSDLGYFVALTIGLALIVDLFLLAPLILIVEEMKQRDESLLVRFVSNGKRITKLLKGQNS